MSGMTFKEARKDFLQGAFQFSGHAPRSEFCWKYLTFYLYLAIAGLVVGAGAIAGVLAQADIMGMILVGIGGLGIVALLFWGLIWGLPLQARRMRDSGQNPWLLLVVYVGAGVIGVFDPSETASSMIHLAMFIYLCAAPSKQGDEAATT
jgi:uncharacterized membrane protein YhaH (DUF805 family)